MDKHGLNFIIAVPECLSQGSDDGNLSFGADIVVNKVAVQSSANIF